MYSAPTVSSRHVILACGIGVLLIAVGICATPYAGLQLAPVPGYMTAFGSAMIVINLLLAALLFSKGAAEQRADSIRLGAAYFFIFAIFLPLTASFPNGIAEGTLIGKPNSAVWLWSYWHAGFGLLILRYALTARAEDGRIPRIWGVIGWVLVLVTLLALTATLWIDYLPSIVLQGRRLFSGWSAVVPIVTLTILGAATIAVARLRARTPEQLWLVVGMVAACFDVWLTFRGGERFSVGWYLSKMGSLITSLAVLISLFQDITRLYADVAAANRVLRDLADRDGLTGLFNRRCLDRVVQGEWRRAQREHQSLAFLMIDVDHFKRFNDHYGHLDGDGVLRRVGDAIARAIQRPGDLVARYGGEEFAVLLPATEAAGAVTVADAILALVRDLAIAHAGNPAGIVTVSIGAAALRPDGTQADTDLIAHADRALYAAKAAGRNQRVAARPQYLPQDQRYTPALP
jgi:diguanylate cyclase (GGDEF)-like protein